MPETQNTTEPVESVEIRPLLSTLNVVDNDAVGCCGGGSCGVPAADSK